MSELTREVDRADSRACLLDLVSGGGDGRKETLLGDTGGLAGLCSKGAVC